jgi:hypothetical protein
VLHVAQPSVVFNYFPTFHIPRRIFDFRRSQVQKPKPFSAMRSPLPWPPPHLSPTPTLSAAQLGGRWSSARCSGRPFSAESVILKNSVVSGAIL